MLLAIALLTPLAANAQEIQSKGVPSGFVLRISLIDFFMIQRGLMQLPDEHAKQTLESVRQQLLDQIKTRKP
jgi:hypothetical protein